MLNELKVLNGIMTPKFDKYNNIYSVNIEENVTELLLEYKANPDYYVKVVGNNNLAPGDNVVYIEVTSDEFINTYKLLVYKEYTQTVFNVKELINTNMEKELPDYVAPLFAFVGVFIIIIFYMLLFKKRKRKRAK